MRLDSLERLGQLRMVRKIIPCPMIDTLITRLLYLVLGTIIGAILVEYASWRWIFWVISIISIPAATACIFLIPGSSHRKEAKISQLDALGVMILVGKLP